MPINALEVDLDRLYSAIEPEPATEREPEIEPARPGSIEDGPLTPPVPETIEETGLTPSVIEQLILKLLYFRGETIGRDLSLAMGLKFSVIEATLEFLKHQHLIGVKRALGMGNISSVFALTETGRNAARDHLDTNQYHGPAPVPLYQYVSIVRSQRLRSGWLTPEALRQAYSHMVMSEQVLSQIGPAVNSGKSFLIYGQPGNGKTYLAEALFQIQSDPVFVPYALESQGQIIQVFDPIYHHPIDDEHNQISALARELTYDTRWFRCPRPCITTGGELAMDMLDLSYNPTSKVYDAPFQLKANNGIYLIDDFGRQRCTPAEVLNRWIVPMERRIDFLSLRTGGKVSVPFEIFLVFSTNLRPEQLGDEAFLRRIQYKMLMRNPQRWEFEQIFERFAQSKNLGFAPETLANFIEKHYAGTNRPFRRCHPRDVLSHAIDLIDFESRPHELTPDTLDRAFESCFLACEESD